jgi:hypothetical protein
MSGRIINLTHTSGVVTVSEAKDQFITQAEDALEQLAQKLGLTIMQIRSVRRSILEERGTDEGRCSEILRSNMASILQPTNAVLDWWEALDGLLNGEAQTKPKDAPEPTPEPERSLEELREDQKLAVKEENYEEAQRIARLITERER